MLPAPVDTVVCNPHFHAVFRLGKMKLLALEVMVTRSRCPFKNVCDSLVVWIRTG